jgi:hypothetical protein
MVDRYTHSVLVQPSDAAQYAEPADNRVVGTMEQQQADTYTAKLAGQTSGVAKKG